ncbi:cereblon family protein [Thermodesulfobacteriota bacterium]
MSAHPAPTDQTRIERIKYAPCHIADISCYNGIMLGYVQTSDDKDDKDPKTYHCSHCGSFITDSEALSNINGAHRHSYVNPAGIRCNFMTFSGCENVIEHEELHLEHSWFPEYGWSFLMCRACYLHLGWKYESVAEGVSPEGFYGVLVNAVEPRAVEE